MSSPDPVVSDPDPDLADALAHAERRRAMLERLSVIGMQLAEQIGAHTAAAMAAINEDKGGDPARAFATVSRAIRLTLALEARVDAQILALRKGRTPAGWALGAQAAPHGRRSCEAARSHEIEESLRPARENLIDRDPAEDFGPGAFGEVVAAIRADLGLRSADVTSALRMTSMDVRQSSPSHFPDESRGPGLSGACDHRKPTPPPPSESKARDPDVRRGKEGFELTGREETHGSG